MRHFVSKNKVESDGRCHPMIKGHRRRDMQGEVEKTMCTMLWKSSFVGLSKTSPNPVILRFLTMLVKLMGPWVMILTLVPGPSIEVER